MISVVIPLYNKAHTIINTLNTVFNQIYQDFEVIIIDDGSTDNSVEIINQNFTDNRIKIIRQKNAGVSSARNRGVDESKGKYIAFLDGDDEWHPEYLSTMHKLIQKYPQAGLFLCAGLIYNADGSVSFRIAPKYESVQAPINLFISPEVFSHTSGTIVRKDIFNQTHRFIYGMKKFEDYLATQAVALLTETIYCGIPLTKYKGGIPGQLTQQNKNNPLIVESEILYFNTIMDDYYKASSSNKVCPIYVKYFLRHIFKLMMTDRNFNKSDFYLNRLSSKVTNLLHPLEIILIKHHLCRLAICWINFTKIIWRMHGFPIVGQKINTNLIKERYLNW
ncbi:glycosyltransferase family 2 protein [Phocaeicola coprocola]|jgi:glycosyltransferase involved in cell wall biosynthesis|uniref:glycosyltransferase family 2 protein n=1 Tax=Phocaeicola coprocola TaxID=310298 RepID=UPI0026DB98B9|nr:glycosyltransferase family A protein [Phocaeicola coprocola]